MKFDPSVVALDLETSGNDPARHDILSIGMVHPHTGREFYAEPKLTEIVAQPAAFRVNNIDVRALDQEQRKPLYAIDQDARAWLWQLLGNQVFRKGIALGINVGSFDLKFVERLMPKTHRVFSYRTMDFNAASFLLDAARGQPLYSHRDAAIEAAKAALPNLRPHHALDDCKLTIKAFEFLGEKL